MLSDPNVASHRHVTACDTKCETDEDDKVVETMLNLYELLHSRCSHSMRLTSKRNTHSLTKGAIDLAVVNHLFYLDSCRGGYSKAKQTFFTTYDVLLQEPLALFRLDLSLLHNAPIMSLISTILHSLLCASRSELEARVGHTAPAAPSSTTLV